MIKALHAFWCRCFFTNQEKTSIGDVSSLQPSIPPLHSSFWKKTFYNPGSPRGSLQCLACCSYVVQPGLVLVLLFFFYFILFFNHWLKSFTYLRLSFRSLQLVSKVLSDLYMNFSSLPFHIVSHFCLDVHCLCNVVAHYNCRNLLSEAGNFHFAPN